MIIYQISTPRSTLTCMLASGTAYMKSGYNMTQQDFDYLAHNLADYLPVGSLDTIDNLVILCGARNRLQMLKALTDMKNNGANITFIMDGNRIEGVRHND
jgi:hypothetical protein